MRSRRNVTRRNRWKSTTLFPLKGVKLGGGGRGGSVSSDLELASRPGEIMIVLFLQSRPIALAFVTIRLLVSPCTCVHSKPSHVVCAPAFSVSLSCCDLLRSNNSASNRGSPKQISRSRNPALFKVLQLQYVIPLIMWTSLYIVSKIKNLLLYSEFIIIVV